MLKSVFASQLRLNMASGVAAISINLVAFALAYPIYLHFVGYEGYGVWLALASVLELAQLGNLGLGPAITKLVAEEHARNNLRGIECYVATALGLLCGSGLVAGALIVYFRQGIIAAFNLHGENAALAISLLPYIALLSLYGFLVQAIAAAVSGLGRIDLAHYTQAGSRVAGVIAASLLLVSGRGIGSLLVGSAVSCVFIHAASLFFVRRIAPVRFLRAGNWDGGYLRRLLTFGGGILGGSVLSMLLSPFNKIVLARFAGVASLPVYDIAFTGSMRVRAMAEVGFRALMPEVSRLGAQGTADAGRRIESLHRRAVKLILLLGLPMYAALFLLAPHLMLWWLGPGFDSLLPSAFRVMLVGTFFSLLAIPAYYILMGLGRVRQCFLAHAVQTGISAGVVVVLMVTAGTVSVLDIAWGTLAAMGATCGYLLWQQRRIARPGLTRAGKGAGSMRGPAPEALPNSGLPARSAHEGFLRRACRGLAVRTRDCVHPRAIAWRWLQRRRPGQPIIARLGDRLNIRIYPCDVIGKPIYIDHVFERKECRFVTGFLKPGMVFFDVGANVGPYTLLAASRVGGAGKVHSFEPTERVFGELEFNVGLNNLAAVCVLNRVALSDAVGRARLSLHEPGAEVYNSLGAARRGSSRVVAYEEVATTTLDAYVAGRGVGRVDLIKMDIEGAELLALRGGEHLLSRPDAPVVLVEMADVNTEGFGYQALEIWEYLERLGYRMCCLDRRGNLAGPAARPADFRHYQNLVAVPGTALPALCGAARDA